MIAGDPADWDDFFQQNLIPAVLSYVISTWDHMEKPEQTAHEDDISIKLYTALVYLSPADNVSRLPPSRLSRVNQPVISTRNRFLSPHPHPLACF